MATFLTTEDIASHFHRIIEEANEELILICPYISFPAKTENLLAKKVSNATIRVVARKARSTLRALPSFDTLGIEPFFLPYLHAKCYLNEREALLTSMNIQSFSQERNREMGILVSKQDDAALYEAIYQQAKHYWEEAGGEPYAAGPGNKEPNEAETHARTTQGEETVPRSGFCIRCAVLLALNPERPYCLDCYRDRNADSTGKEKHCHTCGQIYATSRRKPLCLPCFRKYEDLFADIFDLFEFMTT